MGTVDVCPRDHRVSDASAEAQDPAEQAFVVVADRSFGARRLGIVRISSAEVATSMVFGVRTQQMEKSACRPQRGMKGVENQTTIDVGTASLRAMVLARRSPGSSGPSRRTGCAGPHEPHRNDGDRHVDGDRLRDRHVAEHRFERGLDDRSSVKPSLTTRR
jgi:hypothetical protein